MTLMGYQHQQWIHFIIIYFFDCEISKQYFAEDVGKSGGAEDPLSWLFNVIEQKEILMYHYQNLYLD